MEHLASASGSSAADRSQPGPCGGSSTFRPCVLQTNSVTVGGGGGGGGGGGERSTL